MEVVDTLDIDGTQWEIQDVKARGRIAEIAAETNKIIDTTIDGTFKFSVKMKYLGEDTKYKYYNFWWEPQARSSVKIIKNIEVIPQNTNTDKILVLNLNIHQIGNERIEQRTQHYSGPNNSGIVTYIFDASENPNWTISGMGILRRTK